MLVSGLTDEALSTMISSSQGGYSGVYQSLCECAQAMVDRYRQKQVTPENRYKLEIKTQAVAILLEELSKVPKVTGATREALSSALECHAAALQGHEHLLSEKGNNYQLVKQTQGLRGQAEAIAPLLRYHQLKNKFPGPDSPLNDEQEKVISALDENKGLTLEILEALVAQPGTTARVLAKLYYEAGLLDSDLLTKVVKHEKPDDVAMAILHLHRYELGTENNYSVVLKHNAPLDVALGITSLYSCQLLTDENLDQILRQEDPFNSSTIMFFLNVAGLSDSDLFTKVIKHKAPHSAALAMVELKNAGLFRQDLCTLALEHESPGSATLVITCLNDCGLLTNEYLDYIFKHEQFNSIVKVFFILGKPLCTQGNVYAVINHPDVATLESKLEYHVNAVRESESGFEPLDQGGFEVYLTKTGYIKKT